MITFLLLKSHQNLTSNANQQFHWRVVPKQRFSTALFWCRRILGTILGPSEAISGPSPQREPYLADFPVPPVSPLFLTSMLYNEVSQEHSSFLTIVIYSSAYSSFHSFSICFIDRNVHPRCPLSPSLSMDVIQVYAVAAGGTIFIFILINLLPYLASLWKHISLFTLKHLTYPYLLHRHRFIGPWSRAEVLIQVVYLTVNIFCLSFRVSGVAKTGSRAGTLSLVNMIPLFAGPSFSFAADRLGVPLKVYRYAHRSAGFITFTLVLIHVLSVVSQGSFSLRLSQHLFAVIVSPLT